MKRIFIFAAACIFMFIGCKDKKEPSKIESHCTMNGYGSGKCSFTNVGKGSGSICVGVRLFRTAEPGKYLDSSTLCSGKVEPKESKSKEFTIVGVNAFCSQSGVPWTKVCAFSVTNK